jgi:ketosteroid isomerase-like protein
MKKIISLFTVGLSLCLCVQTASAKTIGHPKADTAAIKQALSKINKQYGEAFIKGDSSLFLNAYTPDACLLPAYMPALCGEKAQLGFYRLLYKAGIRNVVFTTMNIYGMTNQYVTEEGSFETFGANNVPLGKGKYLVVWKETPTGWKMYRDMFSSDAPPSRQPK